MCFENEFNSTPYYQGVEYYWKIVIVFSEYDELVFDFQNDEEFMKLAESGPIISQEKIEDVLFYDKEAAIEHISNYLYSNSWNVNDPEYYTFKPKHVEKVTDDNWLVFDSKKSKEPKARLQIEPHRFLIV